MQSLILLFRIRVSLRIRVVTSALLYFFARDLYLESFLL